MAHRLLPGRVLAGRVAVDWLPPGWVPPGRTLPDARPRARPRPCSPGRAGSGPTTTSTSNGFLRLISGHSHNLHGMTALAPTPEVARPAARAGWGAAEAGLAVAAFAVLCVLVLKATPYLAEPDDSAYRASIVAMTDGHFFTLSGAQAHALAVQLAPHLGGNQLLPGPGGGPIQWVQL